MFLRNSIKTSYRRFSSIPIQISEEVKQALNDKVPVVSLESTIITHGLPVPENLAMAKEVENVIRNNGCVPATIAFIDGKPLVGLNDKQLEYLSTAKNVHKTSRRDIPYVMSLGICGGTTISSTMILSKLAGIKVFATGGLGGVHKHGEITMDVSADLDELSKTEVAVVCSGPKLILDIPKTIEYLETKGVPVTTFNPKHKSNVMIPGFYCEESLTPSPFQFTDFQQLASMIHYGNAMQLGNGYLICIPPPDHLALDKEFIYKVIDEAQFELEKLGILGKNVTPFLLGKINAETQGKSVKCNTGFVLNNAKCATEIAKHLNQLENQGKPLLKSSTKLYKPAVVNNNDHCKSLIIGSIAVDSTCVLEKGYKLKDSNPGHSKQTIGGVGYNVTLSTSFSSSNIDSTPSPRLVSIIGKDSLGDKILNDLKLKGIDNTGFYQADSNTAQYISIHSDDGSLIVACADMDIIESLPKSHIIEQLQRAQPEYVLMDSNISTEIMAVIVDQSTKMNYKILLEPTSIVKAAKIGKVRVGTWPNNEILLLSPTCEELTTIYESLDQNEKFADLDNWFNVLDRLGLDSNFRNELNAKANKNPWLSGMIQKGVLQQLFKILPYISNLIIKDGKNGILVVQIVTNANELRRGHFSNSKASFSLVTQNGKEYQDGDESKKLGILVQHYDIPVEIPLAKIKNVTGAGDSMIGYLYKKLIQGDEFLTKIDHNRDSLLLNCQVVAGLSLQCEEAINIKEISDIE